MALNLRNPETERMAAELARLTGQTKTRAVTDAIRERLERVRSDQTGQSRRDRLRALARRCARLPELDPRPADEIIGYDENGLPI